MKGFRAVIAISSLCLVIGISLIACSSAPNDCTGEITAAGKTYTARTEGQDNAKRFTCNKYCLDTDSECEAMYGIWVTSPKGKAAGSPPKMRALSEDKQLLDCVTVKCANRCLDEVKAGKIQMKLTCK